MKAMKYQDKHGVHIEIDDKVKLVGRPTLDDKKNFVQDMLDMMNDGKTYHIEDFDHHNNGKFYIDIDGWWFESKFIEKIRAVKNIAPQKTKPIMFNIENLVIE